MMASDQKSEELSGISFRSEEKDSLQIPSLVNNTLEGHELSTNEAEAGSSTQSDEDYSEDEESEEFEDPDDVLTKLRKSTEGAYTLYLLQPMLDALNSVQLSSEDVLIAGYPKSGTNWVEQICHQIRTHATDEDFDELTEEVPLLQLFSIPLGYDLHSPQKGDYKLFKTHDVMSHLPETAATCKTIIMFRNPYNTLASYFRWEPSFTGYDPRCEITMEQFFEYKFNYKKTQVPLTYWEFVASWLELSKTKQNCLIIFYENLCSDFDTFFEQIRAFLGTGLSTCEKERVKYLSSFEYMKANESKFDLHGLREKIHELAENEDYYIEKTATPSFVNLGAKRNGKPEIPQNLLDIMAQEWQDNIRDRFGYEDYEAMRHALTKG